jgi:heterodisulfide reductase subunit A
MAEQNLGAVLVVGAGVGGIKASIDLAERGCRVILAESSPALGGILSQLDHQFPNNHCGLCRMLPAWERDTASDHCMRKGLFHENIRILPMTELAALEGEAGRFEAVLRSRPRGVDPGRCIGCGRCEEICPVEVEDGFNEGLAARRAIHREIPHNVPFSYVIDFEACTRCGECVTACPTEAVSLEGEEEETSIEVGAVILSPGCGLYDPGPPDAYNYNALPDVVTGLELERLLSGSGPTGGRLLRPSTGEPARSVAWIQCVGSRNAKRGQDFCSSICCMFALKETLLVKESSPETETALFYMDLRAYGKEGYRYQLRAEAAGTEMIQCRVHSVEAGPDGRLYLRHYVEEEGVVRERAFDLVVLSTGQASTPEMQRLAEAAGVELNGCGFAPGRGLDPTATNRPGVFWCGSATGLKEISETVLQAESAAAGAALQAGLPSSSPEAEGAPTRDVSRELPRVGVLLCRCMDGQQADLPWEEIRRDLEARPDTARVVEGDRLCLPEGLAEAASGLAGQDLNRLVVGACAPYVYDRRLRRLGRGLGLAEDLVEVVDLRGAGLGTGEADAKRRQAESTIGSAVLKMKHREFPGTAAVPAIQGLVIVGGGLAGMTAALAAAEGGLGVLLLERKDRLGGETARRRYTLDGLDPAAYMKDLEERVRSHERIEVRTGAVLAGLSGEPGRFVASIRAGGEEVRRPCGALILATGAREAETEAYGLGRSDRILRQGDLEDRLAAGQFSAEDLGRVVMIQCAGSRDLEGRAYCSRICCASALKNAARILEIHPESSVYVLYRDLMSYGFMESRYRELRERGVQFITYRPEKRPEVEVDADRVGVRFQEPVLGRPVEVHPDLLVLSTGLEPRDNASLNGLLGLELNEDGFLQELDPKYRPVDLNRPGVFACGTALSPRSMSETVVQARAAAMRAVNLLGRAVLPASRAVSDVRHALCALCEACISVCPFEARVRDKDRIRVIPSACQGCGLCVASCPSGAARLPMLTDRQAMGMIEGLMD